MATWTAATFAFESLLTSTKMAQVQDNFTGLAEGASGAPKVLAAALSQTGGSEAVVAGAIRSYAVTLAKLEPYAAGSKVEAQVSASSLGIFQSVSYEKKAEFGIPRAGVLTATWSANADAGGSVGVGLYVNGSALVTQEGAGFLTSNYDVTVAAGDNVQLYLKNRGGNNPYAFHFTLSVSSGTTFRNL
jgi:hypothetical protein